MKRILHFVLLLLAAFPAFADDISLGYCDGGNVETSLSGTQAVAMQLPSGEFPMYAGAKIIGVRIGVGTDVVAGVRVFLRNALTGDDIYTERTPELYKGWNDITFSSSIDYPASDLYVGYETSSNVRAGVSGQNTKYGCWAQVSGEWTDYAVQGEQPLCIELLIDGESYTKNDIALLSANDVTTSQGSSFAVGGRLRNNTNQVLTTARLTIDYGNGPIEADATVDEVLPGESGAFSLPLEGVSEIGDHNATIGVASVNGKGDDYSFNDTATCLLRVVEEITDRNILIEDFTGQACPNCPSGTSRLEEGVRGETNYIIVSHHTGYGDDTMTAPGLDDLHYFYNEGGTTYAPGIMIDRQNFASQGATGLNGAAPGPVFVTPASSLIRQLIEQEKAVAPSVAVNLLRNYNPDTRELKVQVAMHHISGMPVADNPVLSVCLTEDGIIAYQRPNYSNYVHNKVNRGFLTRVLGDPVSLPDGEKVYATYTTTLDASWKPENMQVVAFVSNYDNTDCNNCGVYNATSATLEGNDEFVDGISQPQLSHSAEVEAIYNLSGVRLDEMQKGINIVRFKDGTTRKIVK